MQAAGLNPMLAYSQGGASAPMGSMPQVQNAVGAGVSSANQTSNTIQALQALEANRAQIEQVKATTDKIKSETMERELNTAKLAADVAKAEAEEPNIRAEWRGKVADSSRKMEELDSMLRAGGFSAQAERQRAELAKTQEEAGLRKAQKHVTEADLARAKSEEKFYDDLGQANPYLKQLIMMMKFLSSAKATFK